jgi:putative membrane protein
MMFGSGIFGRYTHFGYGVFSGWYSLIILGAIIFLVGFLITRRKKQTRLSGDYVLSLLKEKFVNGEITEDEYLNKKKILTS